MQTIAITNTKSLFDILQKHSSVIKSSTMTVLENIKISFENEVLSFTITDLETQVTKVIDNSIAVFTCKEKKDFLVPVKNLLSVCKTLGNVASDFTFGDTDADGEGSLKISSGKCTFKLKTTVANEYPTINIDLAKKPSFSIDANMLKAMLKSVAFSSAKNDTRYYLNGVFFEIRIKDDEDDGRYLNVVGTDGHRLSACESKQVIGKGESYDFIVPNASIRELLKICENQGTIDFFVTDEKASFLVKDNVNIVIKLVDGTFPDYRKVIPQKPRYNVESINIKDFINVLNRAVILAHEQYSGIRIELDNGQLTISSTNPRGDSSEIAMDVDYSGDAVEVAVNCKYLISALKASNANTINLGLYYGDDHKPAGLLLDAPLSDYNLKYIIMVMKL